ncbi:hypothetical protein ACJZ2D_013123 [Fusarium nematophilum]
MARTLYLVMYNSRLFPAHWALWVPSREIPDVGKRIHAEGDVATGFTVTFERNYDIGSTGRQHQILPLAEVDESHLADVPGARSTESKLMGNIKAHDTVEEVALRVPAPGPSLRSASSAPRSRVEIRNCQTWIYDLVDQLVREGIVDESALKRVKEAPKN